MYNYIVNKLFTMSEEHIHYLTRNLKQKLEFLEKNGKLSIENYNSLEQPFMTTNTNLKFKQDNKPLPIIPDTLNNDIKLLYKIIGNPSVEITVKSWTIISLNKALYLYEEKRKKKQFVIFDIAFQYCGMGWIKVLSCDLLTGKLFYRNDGGSNGLDRQLNEDKIINYDKKKYTFITFDDWFDNLNVYQNLF